MALLMFLKKSKEALQNARIEEAKREEERMATEAEEVGLVRLFVGLGSVLGFAELGVRSTVSEICRLD